MANKLKTVGKQDTVRARKKAKLPLDYGKRMVKVVNEGVEQEADWTKEGTSIGVDRIAQKSRVCRCVES